MLGLKDIFDLKKKYQQEPFGLRIPILRDESRLKADLVKWVNDKPIVIAFITFSKVSNDLWEIDEVRLRDSNYKGVGKLMYYLAMNAIYPAYLTPDGSGVSKDALRVYKGLEDVTYVESMELFPSEQGKDVLKDEFTILNRMYRFKFPKFRS